MEIDVARLLTDNPMLLIFTVIGLGYLVGNIQIAGTQSGPVIGVLLAGLLLGHLGYSAPEGASAFGFALFIFSVGIQAGPTFFSAFLADGPRYVALALVVALTALFLAMLFSRLIGLDHGFGAGLLAGALTSTPTLAGAQDAVNSGLAAMPEGSTRAEVLENISVGYAITYVFGTVGMILAVRFFPRIAGIDLAAEAEKLAKERGLGRSRRRGLGSGPSLPIVRAYRVAPSSVGKSVQQVYAERGRQAGKILKLKRGKKLIDVSPDLVIEEGDLISVITGIDMHEKARELGLTEVLDPALLKYQVNRREIIVAHPRVVGRTLRDLNMPGEYGCFAAELTRASIDLPVDSALPLQKGDRLDVIGEERNLQRLAEAIGYVEKDLEKTDLATFAFGMIGGILLGLVMISLGDISVGLGTAGGLMIAGIVIGYLGSVMPTFGRVPAAARYVIKELGLMLFMAAVGLNAGGGVVEALASVGPLIILSGIVVTLVPALVGYLVGRRVLGLNPALLLGSITGAMTSTPALNVVTEAARSSVPALGYAGTYTFANVLLTFAGSVMMVL
jgi:putative transport protein